MVLYYILLPLAWLVFHIGFRVHTVGRENLRKVHHCPQPRFSH